ncbi:putative ribosome biogenesis GTPase RsgA [Posidoniimonas polymericola]|uniref:Small ribosomal subunit biogenesis GTPase RsgA n=1 Tax=Posidoniimonas polymericola TaxID=2528002 RepID=A0A5C5YII3_9BACT|nr:ribosome small subunit-dependent GTPase A [Posidoniimonas polymericola]TWT74669.1 putative ribosome biogenesis GTPase RsgA [Posidoniimonas polymericola]
MDTERLTAIGWKPCFERQLPADVGDGLVVARVSAHYGSQVLLLGEAGDRRAPAQLAEAAGELAVGDWLIVTAADGRAVQRLERQTLLYRKAAGEQARPQLIAANIDTLFIVSSCNADFNLSRTERYLALAIEAGAEPVVVLTKADLCEDPANDPAHLRRQVERLRPGLIVETLDARDPEQANVLRTWCGPGQTVALLGSSGVGKSTLAMALGVGDLATAAIREDDAKGRHTTTARSLYLMPGGGVLVDNPGIRELQLPACVAGVESVFEDVVRIAEGCRFRNCRHEGDAGCAVIAAVESGELDQRRYANYLKLLAEQAHNARTLVERREQDRQRGRYIKSVLKDHRRRREET